MESKLTITIRRRSQPEWLIWLMVFLLCLFGVMFNLLRLPSMLKYLMDFFWVCLLLFIILKCLWDKTVIREYKALYIWTVIFFVYTFIVYIFRFQSFFYYFWGLRNNIRFYVFFLACCIFLNYRSGIEFFSLFDKLFWINAVVTFIQFFVFGIKGDLMGGIFGTDMGCNSYINLFFIIISAKSMICYLNKKETLMLCIVKGLIMMIIAAFAELKFFFAEYIIIIALAVLITEFSWRKLIFVVGSVSIVLLGTFLLTSLFPNSEGLMTLDAFLDRASSEAGYTSSGDVNRLTAIPILSSRFLKTLPDKLFGLGLGNCDTSSFAICNTPFFQRYGQLHYTWFTAPMVFLEMGYLGLGLYLLFFVFCIRLTWRKMKTGEGNKLNCQLAIMLAVMCIILVFYNSSLRIEAGYMIYFVLALPFIRSDGKEITVAA